MFFLDNRRKNMDLWTGRDLNPRPLPCEGSDLPADLPAPNIKIGKEKILFEIISKNIIF